MAYSEKVIDHYQNPKNVGTLDKSSKNVGTGLVGAPECGDVMRLQIEVNSETGMITDAKFKTFGCGSAIASSSLATEWLKGKSVDEALKIDSIRGLSETNIHHAQATAWRSGQLLFDNTSIGEAVEMLNRYLHKKVIVADDVSRSIKISGTFSSRQKKETLAAVTQALGLELTPRGNKWLLSQPNP